MTVSNKFWIAHLASMWLWLVANAAPGAFDPKPPAAPPPATSTQPTATQPAAEIALDKLRFRVPEGWITQQPTSAMRKAQFRLPGEGEGNDAELAIFYFGPGPNSGGGVQANFDRWIGQFRQDDGRNSKELAVIKERKIGELTVHTLDLTGHYVAPITPGAPETHDKPNSRMLGAVIETPEGNYFLKLVGPAATVQQHVDKYEAFLTSLRRVP